MSNEYLNDNTPCVCKHSAKEHRLRYTLIDDVVVDDGPVDPDTIIATYAACTHNDCTPYDTQSANYCSCTEFKQDNLEVLRRKFEEKKRDRR